ncbi:MAG: hypothetical protein BroJett011_05300 [Chloroflexota bacterium]|nr:MAG: hypothetical protein BroJett011_05300 [Chloroflexota bacterium]
MTQQQTSGVKGTIVNSHQRINLIVFTVYTLCTLVLTHPLLFNLTTAVPSDIGDPLLNTWILAWDSHALLADPLNLFNANIFYPLPNTLAYSEHLFSTALLALPLQLIFAEPIAAYNLTLLLTFPLAAISMYLLALRLTRQRSAAFIAGLIFAFAPYRFAAIAHLQLLTFQWLPFALLFIDKLLDQKKFPHPLLPTPYSLLLASTIFLLLQLLASWYLALYTFLILGIFLLTALFTQRLNRSNFVQLSVLFLISIFLILPFAWPYLSILDDLRTARPLSLALSLAAAPTDFIAAAPFNRLFGPLTEFFRTRPGFTEENTLFIGLTAPLLALIALLRFTIYDLRFTTGAPISGIDTSRPTPHALRSTLYAFLAILLVALALTFPTPYATLAQLIPASAIIRVPPRWIIPALFALAGLAAFGYSLITHHASRFTPHAPRITLYFNSILFILTCAFLLLETLSIPLPLAPVENRNTLNPAYHWLAGQPGPIALIELPLHSAPAPEYPEVKRLYASTLGWWRLVNGYSGYTPSRQPHLAQTLADFPGPTSITALQNLTLLSKPSLPPSTFPTFHPSNPPTLPSPLLFFLVHPGEAPFDRTRWETIGRWQVERNPALLPIVEFEGDYLYQVLPPDSTRFAAPPLATFGQEQTIQLLAYEISTPALQLSTRTPQLSSIFHPLSSAPRLTLSWRSSSPLPADYTVFIHFRAADGFVRSQADGPPVSGHYLTSAWQPGEIIQDIHSFPEGNLAQTDHLAVGLYDPATNQRLPAFDAAGQRLADDTLIIPLH